MNAFPPGAHRLEPVDFVVLDALRCYWQELPPGPTEQYIAVHTTLTADAALDALSRLQQAGMIDASLHVLVDRVQ